MDKKITSRALDKDTLSRALKRLREPSGAVTDAMAAEARASERRNGHGLHGFRDMWQAGIDAALLEVAA